MWTSSPRPSAILRRESRVTLVRPCSIREKFDRVIPILAASTACESPAFSRASRIAAPSADAARLVLALNFDFGTPPRAPCARARPGFLYESLDGSAAPLPKTIETAAELTDRLLLDDPLLRRLSVQIRRQQRRLVAQLSPEARQDYLRLEELVNERFSETIERVWAAARQRPRS